MFNPLSVIFGWGWKIRKLRKRWDRLREKTLKKEPSLRKQLFPKEDHIEEKLKTLEERKLVRSERARLAKEIEIDLAEVKAMLQSEDAGPYGVPENRPQKEQQKVKEQSY